MICRKCKKERRSFSVMHSKGSEPQPVGVCDFCFGIKKEKTPSEIASKASEKETLAEVSTDLNEEQREANESEITLQQEDK